MPNGKNLKQTQNRIRRNRRRAMPLMRSEDEKIIAIFLADVHLSLRPPVWRSAEPDWLEAQSRPLSEVKELQEEYKCPVICAGDIFERWNCSPELINFAIKFLPDNIYAIPGQHDLPLHQIEDIHRSAYWTLVKAGKIIDFSYDLINIGDSQLTLYGFPYSKGLDSLDCESKFIQIAVVHDYIWTGKCGYPNAPKEKKIYRNVNDYGKYFGYDVIIYGDNHQGFCIKKGETTIFNCGTLMRRKSDEIDYKPQVGLLLESGEVIPHYLDISKDKYLETIEEEEVNPELDMKSFIEELEKLDETAFDFAERMKQFLQQTKKISVQAKQIILNAMEK